MNDHNDLRRHLGEDREQQRLLQIDRASLARRRTSRQALARMARASHVDLE